MEAGGKGTNKRWRKQGWRPQKKEGTKDILSVPWGQNFPSSSAVNLNQLKWLMPSLVLDSTDQREAESLQ